MILVIQQCHNRLQMILMMLRAQIFLHHFVKLVYIKILLTWSRFTILSPNPSIERIPSGFWTMRVHCKGHCLSFFYQNKQIIINDHGQKQRGDDERNIFDFTLKELRSAWEHGELPPYGGPVARAFFGIMFSRIHCWVARVSIVNILYRYFHDDRGIHHKLLLK